jgi:hypothetical protein
VELKRLLYRHPNTFPNPEIIIQGAKHFAMMGDISLQISHTFEVLMLLRDRHSNHNSSYSNHNKRHSKKRAKIILLSKSDG